MNGSLNSALVNMHMHINSLVLGFFCIPVWNITWSLVLCLLA